MRRMTVIVFAREPVPGQTKTRLIPAIGKNNAARSPMLSIATPSRRPNASQPPNSSSREVLPAAPNAAAISKPLRAISAHGLSSKAPVTSARGWPRRCVPSPMPEAHS